MDLWRRQLTDQVPRILFPAQQYLDKNNPLLLVCTTSMTKPPAHIGKRLLQPSVKLRTKSVSSKPDYNSLISIISEVLANEMVMSVYSATYINPQAIFTNNH